MIVKDRLIQDLIAAFVANGNQEHVFNEIAGQRLGVNRTDRNCLEIIARTGGLTAGELASEARLTTGAVTGVIDRLERAGYARRVRDAGDRRRITIHATPRFHAAADEIWGPMSEDWQAMMRGYTVDELRLVLRFIRGSNEVGRRHLDRVSA
jgi:DNA-binding MarR family transcriptional regulator